MSKPPLHNVSAIQSS